MTLAEFRKQGGFRMITKEPKSEAKLSEAIASYLRKNHPGVPFNADVLAGINLSIRQGSEAKKQGKTKSWPDFFIATPRRGYNGLFVEIKKAGERIFKVRTPDEYASEHIEDQAKMLQRLRNEGYYAQFAVGYQETIKLIEWYLSNSNKKEI